LRAMTSRSDRPCRDTGEPRRFPARPDRARGVGKGGRRSSDNRSSSNVEVDRFAGRDTRCRPTAVCRAQPAAQKPCSVRARRARSAYPR
jgi:hypothetical protein